MKCPKCGSETYHHVRVIGINKATGLLQTDERLLCFNPKCSHEKKVKT